MKTRKKLREEKRNNSKGITLIALVITIIVLLILAGISIATLTGENGILTQASSAKNETKSKGLKEEIQLAVQSKNIADQAYRNGNLEEELKRIEGATVTTVEDGTYCVERDGYSYTVYDNGKIEEGKLDKWDGTTIEAPIADEQGNWHIYTASLMKFFANFCNNVLTEVEKTEANMPEITDDTIVYLENNIDMGARQEEGGLTTAPETQWTPIGMSKGTFDGKEHYITGIYVQNAKSAGIFSTAKTIINLSVQNSYIESSNQLVGGIVGSIINEIKNCHNINTTVKSTLEFSFVGGIVGNTITGKVNNCTNSGNIIGKDIVAGIMGGTVFSGSIENCYNEGEIKGNNAIGGIVGTLNPNITVRNCYNTGRIVGESSCIGGIVGDSYGIIETCYNKGEISGIDKVGGIAGEIAGSSAISVTNCYNKGKVSGNSNIGAIIGSNTATGTVTFSKLYYLQSLGIGGINGADIEGQAEGTNEDIDSYENFLSWIETK